MREISVKKIAFVVMVAVMAAFALKINVAGEEDSARSNRAYYHELENRYREVLNASLNKHGLYNTGITISSIINPDGSRAYKVMLHNDKIDYMDEAQQQAFMDDLSKITFADNESPISYSIL